MIMLPPSACPRLTKVVLRAVSPIHRRYGAMTVEEARTRLMRHWDGPGVYCRTSVTYNADRTVREVSVTPDNAHVLPSGSHRCHLPLLVKLPKAAEALRSQLLLHLVEDEVAFRYAAGIREVLHLSQEVLQDLEQEVAPLTLTDFVRSQSGLSDRLLYLLARRELAVRPEESNHERLRAQRSTASFWSATRRTRQSELARSRKAWQAFPLSQQSTFIRRYGMLGEDAPVIFAYRSTLPI